MTLKDYYKSLEKPDPPKTAFVREIAEKCSVEENTVRFWIRGYTRPQNPDHVKILSEVTGIEVDKLWNNEDN